MNTLIDMIRAFAELPPSRGITFYPEDLEDGHFVAYRELHGLIGESMQLLREAGVGAGDRVIVPFESERDVLVAFLALVGIGALPLSIKPYTFGGDRASYAEFVQTVVERYRVRHVLCTSSVAELALAGESLALPRPTRSTTPELIDAGPEDLAFVQFSSGSTAFPKGVPVHHGRAIANMRFIVSLDERRPEDPGSTWLPLYHDMGLIGLMTCLMVGSPAFLHSPAQFLMDPIGWLHHMSRTRSTVFVTPNFGIDYALRRLRDAEPDALDGLDLSALQWVYLGSEPINMDTLDELCERLRPYGLRREVFKPCYGMAESVLIVTCAGREHGPRQRSLGPGAPLVSVGKILPGFELDIVDEDGRSLEPGQLGEIMLRGGTLAARYFESETPICDEGQFYATGDLGCIHEGELYIAGRVGDRMKVNGQSYFASAFEQIVELLPFVRPGRVAVLQPGEQVTVLAELRDVRVLFARRQYQQALCDHLFSKTGVKVRPEDVYFVRHGQLQKTSSGKLRRAAMAQAIQSGQLIETDLVRHTTDRLRGYFQKIQYLRHSARKSA